MFDVRNGMLGQVRLIGQISQNYNINPNSPGIINYGYPGGPFVNPGYGPPPSTYGGGGGGGGQAAYGGSGDCFTCTHPDTGDVQYGVPPAMADQLKNSGYLCRKDQCANRNPGGGGGFTGFGGVAGPSGSLMPSTMEMNPGQGGFTSYAGPSSMMGRIPLAQGLGRRVFGG